MFENKKSKFCSTHAYNSCFEPLNEFRCGVYNVSNSTFHCKAAFTLTEVIIAIIIMGALAIVLIPNLLNMMPDDHSLKYKKAFFTIQEIVKDISSNCQNATYNSNTKHWTPVSNSNNNNILSYCYKKAEGGYTARTLTEEIVDRLNTTEEFDSNTNEYQTTNGMIWWIPSQSLATNSGWWSTIYVNVGSKKSINDLPNKENCNQPAPASGCEIPNDPDAGIYRIRIHSSGKLYPGSQGNTGETEDNFLMKNPTED